MPNMHQIISRHNKKVMNKDNAAENTTNNCNCRMKDTCPLNGQCQTTGVIYQATVKRQDNDKDETYVGLTENTFKTRYNAHKHSFRNQNNKNATTLSQYIWKLKDNGISHSLKWRVLDRGKAFTPETKDCNLCLKEKQHILYMPKLASLNSRNELISTCRHKSKYLLRNIT